jgi:RimJ/RimL family protein N-acetyltransferase
VKLVEIGVDGALSGEAGPLHGAARDAVASTVELYSRVGWARPWIGYLAFEGGDCAGTCAFTRAPREGVVEIAYHTFPGHEGRGVATRMAERLVSMSLGFAPEVAVTAHTLPAESASTRVLRRVGFALVGPTTHAVDGPIWVWRFDGAGQPGRPAGQRGTAP